MTNKSLILSIILLLNISYFVLGEDIEICLVIGGYCQDTSTLPSHYYDLPSGTKCLNNTVVQYTKIGGNCTTLSCDSDYATCDNGTCVLKPWAQIGEKCSNNDDCDRGICTLGLCELESGEDCDGDDFLCKSSDWCNGTVCTPKAQKGESCENIPCSIGTFCDETSNLCKSYFTLEEGNECENNIECNYSKGLVCDSDICKKQELEILDDCVSSSDSCNGDLQYCSINSTKCETKMFINTACKNTYTKYYSCLAENNCQELGDGLPSPAGCIIKNCGAEYCQIRKGCDISYCGMNYNSYLCDAIIGKTKKPIETEDPSNASILTISNVFILFIIVLLF